MLSSQYGKCYANPIPTRSTRKTIQNPILVVSQLCKIDSVHNSSNVRGILTKRSKEPSVLARRITLLQCLLDSLLRFLPLRNLLECICGDNSLQSFQIEVVSRGHQMVVVHDLDEWLDLATLGLSCLGHAAGDLRGVTLDAGD